MPQVNEIFWSFMIWIFFFIFILILIFLNFCFNISLKQAPKIYLFKFLILH